VVSHWFSRHYKSLTFGWCIFVCACVFVRVSNSFLAQDTPKDDPISTVKKQCVSQWIGPDFQVFTIAVSYSMVLSRNGSNHSYSYHFIIIRSVIRPVPSAAPVEWTLKSFKEINALLTLTFITNIRDDEVERAGLWKYVDCKSDPCIWRVCATVPVFTVTTVRSKILSDCASPSDHGSRYS